jgi:hypothetical protein
VSFKDEVELLQKKVAELERLVDLMLSGRESERITDVMLRGHSDLERREVSIEKSIKPLDSTNWNG